MDQLQKTTQAGSKAEGRLRLAQMELEGIRTQRSQETDFANRQAREVQRLTKEMERLE